VALYRSWQRFRSKAFSVLASGAFASFGSRSVVQLPVRLNGEGQIAVGDDVFVGAGCWLQVLGEPGPGARIEIGDGTSIVGDCVISASDSIVLGDRVLIARNAYLADHMHGFEDTRLAVMDQPIERVGPIEIGDGAWLGENVVVGPGVRIGAGAVIGANSVVLADVPDHSVAVGAPARVVRSFSGPPAADG
jgi:acetyltransferase-like isoleucine patch superfamily enzyme